MGYKEEWTLRKGREERECKTKGEEKERLSKSLLTMERATRI